MEHIALLQTLTKAQTQLFSADKFLETKYSADKTSEQAHNKLPLLKNPHTQLYPPPSSLSILLMD